MGEQYRYRLMEGGVVPQVMVRDIYGDYGNNEMKTRNSLKNEIKTLNEIPIRINVGLPSLRTILRDIGRQFCGCYTFGDYLEEHGYEVTKNGKYVWFIKRR